VPFIRLVQYIWSTSPKRPIMFKKIIITSLLITFVQLANAQKITQFSTDSVKYIKELNDYFYDNSANKKEAEEYVLNFQKIWKSPDFSSKYRAVYKTSNSMLQRKLKPYPLFYYIFKLCC
jgi:hypothetical protein